MIEQPFENWLPIPEYEDLYEIDTYGNIRSFDKKVKNNNSYRIIKGKILKPKLDNKGYYKIGLTKDKKQKFYFIHRLVALTYLPNPKNYKIINHKDGNPKNNYVENLEWCTQQYNIQHAYHNGLNSYRKRHLYKKRCEDAIKYINIYCPMLPSETKPIWNKILNILEDKNE